MFITPVFNTGSTGKNDKLIRLIENELQKAEKEHPQLVAEYWRSFRRSVAMHDR